MNRRAFFKTVGIPALALPFVRIFPSTKKLPTDGIEIISAPGIYKAQGNCYERHGTIRIENRKWYIDVICPVCGYDFNAIRPRYPQHVGVFKIPPTYCNECNHLLRIAFEHPLPQKWEYRQITEAIKMKNPYRAYYHP